MKTILLFVGVIAILSFSSCRKRYDCTCVTTDSSSSTYSETNTFNSFVRMKKKEAESWCNNFDENYTYTTTDINGNIITSTLTTECELD